METPSLRKLVVLLIVLNFALGCGGGGGGGGVGTQTQGLAQGSSEILPSDAGGCGQAVALPQSLVPTFDETEQCTNLSAPPPAVILSATVACPTSGELHCLASVPFFPCPDDPSKLCGAAGRFLPECNAIELPDQWTDAAAHEMIHYLLRASGHDDWAAHSDPAFGCQ